MRKDLNLDIGSDIDLVACWRAHEVKPGSLRRSMLMKERALLNLLPTSV